MEWLGLASRLRGVPDGGPGRSRGHGQLFPSFPWISKVPYSFITSLLAAVRQVGTYLDHRRHRSRNTHHRHGDGRELSTVDV